MPIPALESFKALDQLFIFSLDSLDGIVQQLLNNAPMDIPYAIEHSQPLFAAIVSPLYSQVDPYELGNAGRALATSEEYAMRVMERWGYSEIEDDERQRMVRHLVWNYPTHGFVIDLKEAQQIGLKAARLDHECDKVCREILALLDSADIPRYIDIEIPPPDVQDKENRHEPKGKEIAERDSERQQDAV